MLNQRKFSVESLTSGEYLVITQEDLDKMKRNFAAPSRIFWKRMIEQFYLLLTYNCQCVTNFEAKMRDPKFLQNLQQHRTPKNYMKESARRLNQFTTEMRTQKKENQSDSGIKWSDDSEDDNSAEQIKKPIALHFTMAPCHQ
jgi:hypothetical protein